MLEIRGRKYLKCNTSCQHLSITVYIPAPTLAGNGMWATKRLPLLAKLGVFPRSILPSKEYSLRHPKTRYFTNNTRSSLGIRRGMGACGAPTQTLRHLICCKAVLVHPGHHFMKFSTRRTRTDHPDMLQG